MRYEIKGGNFPVAICQLDANESIMTEGGAMSWMSPNMSMQTSGNGLGKMIGRIFSGEKMFQNKYTSVGTAGEIAFASKFPGDIMALDISPDNEYVIQKSAYLASEPGVELSVFFQKRVSSGFFGGEGFIMQRLSGNGTAFVEIDGSAVRYQLQPGQKIIVDTGHVVLMSATCSMDIQTVKGVKNVLFGGEGLFNTVVTGPGEVVLQTMPTVKLAQALMPYLPSNTNSSN
ncbi:TIGR00266 family protein [uncultured Eubacterium sp.]|uniref:TIGR00266 family protein n=1 Tax=uncultured Eubacterium sp. TaxID=165185 RepID=UPI0015AE34A1|nr:TIGR00266 family protein [uncultured Eubacterium sp.]